MFNKLDIDMKLLDPDLDKCGVVIKSLCPSVDITSSKQPCVLYFLMCKIPKNVGIFYFSICSANIVYFQFPIILCMGNFGNHANLRLSVFGRITRFGVWRIQKTQNQHDVQVFFSQSVYQSVETISIEQIAVKTSFWF